MFLVSLVFSESLVRIQASVTAKWPINTELIFDILFQWLCNKDKSDHNPIKRLYSLFSSLYACLVSCIGSVAVLTLVE